MDELFPSEATASAPPLVDKELPKPYVFKKAREYVAKAIQPALSLDLTIPDLPIEGGAARAYSGDVMQQVLIAMLGLDLGPTNGAEQVCPDAYTKEGRPVEIKSLRFKNKCVIYDWRLEKDPPDQLYVIGVHNRGKCYSLAAIWEGLSKEPIKIFILTKDEMARLAYAQDLQKIGTETTSSGKRNGYQRKGYCKGYRNIPYHDLASWCSVLLPFRVSCMLHSLHFSASIFMSRNSLLEEPTPPNSTEAPTEF